MNPFLAPVPSNGRAPICQARRLLEPIIAEHMEGFGAALENRCKTPEDVANRVRANTMLRVASAAALQARTAAEGLMAMTNPAFALAAAAGQTVMEDTTNHVLTPAITNFITQMIHMNLEVYPRLIATRLVSVQPFTQPQGYIFYLKRVAKDDGQAGDGRSLADKDTFDATYADIASEGAQLKAVGITLEKELVECKYKGLVHKHSWPVDVALRTQYGLDVGQLGDLTSADELAWEVDREVVDGVLAYAITNPRGTAYFDDTANGTYATLAPSEQQAYDKLFVRKTLTQVQIEMAADIYRQPNWYICGINIAKLLARTPEAMAEKTGDSNYFDQAAVRGAIIQSGRMRDGGIILMDPQLDADTMVCGYVDQMNPFYAGYAFGMFGAASILTAAWMDPDNLLTKKGRALAFYQKGINPKQFRRIKLGTGVS